MPSKGVKSFRTRQDKQKMIEKLKKKTHFSKLEIEKLLEMQRKLSTRGNKIDRSKFRDLLHNTFAITEDFIMDRVFKAFDKDNDSHLNEEEWILGMSVFLRGTIDELCKYCFDVYDMNSDGFISREEMFHLLKQSLIVPGNEQDDPDDGVKDLVEVALKKLDQDHDTRVSFEDFKTSIHDDNLLLECFGRCLPNLPRKESFLEQIADEAHLKK
ncbi:Hypothetical predicted protein [Mytilus galloprovincialis]|uniref:EF-hand domain-containing protein n=1 Tax=Mytilus galloprovincialis TaxID=29158 RepID=A0A8B6FT81_MYTGA|nr:Hypothetical predicted protein [Mytilus galloprovincialis]